MKSLFSHFSFMSVAETLTPKPRSALKGPNHSADRLARPFRADATIDTPFPGRCPGLGMVTPFGRPRSWSQGAFKIWKTLLPMDSRETGSRRGNEANARLRDRLGPPPHVGGYGSWARHAIRQSWGFSTKLGVALILAWGVGVREASARLVLVGETVQRTAVAPGGVVSGTITVLNRGTEPAEVRFYQTDYHFTSAGESDFAAPGTKPRSNARWLTLDANQASISPNATVEVNYRGTVPGDAGLRGTYWSLIMVEQTEAVQAPVPGTNPRERKAAIRTVVRHAVQVVNDLGAPVPAALKVLRKALDHDSQSKSFLLDVENQGEWMVRPEVSLELFDASGTSKGKLEAAKVRLYPGCSFRYRFDLKGVPPGSYTGLVVLDTGDENLSGAQYSLEVP